MSQYKLVVAEKPSVAKAISAVLGANERKDGFFIGNGYIVSWCVGHLLGLAYADGYDEKYKKWCYEDLPIIPEEWKHTPAKDRKKQLATLRELMNRSDVESVVNACDSGREGELIFRLVYENCQCDKPMQRLWISSMEDSAIRDGFKNLRPGEEYNNLYAAALCREKSDWLVGVNATRLFSVLYRQPLNVGRVMSPTLAMMDKREQEIKDFVKEPFYTVELETGTFIAASDKIKEKTQAENIKSTCDGQTAAIHTVETTEKKTAPPKLYDLTTLQREANRQYGYTAQQTLDYVQSLYDKQLATYPRTDSRYLTEDMAMSVPVLVNLSALMVPGIRGFVPIEVHEQQVIDNKKVSDHHALLPTKEIQHTDLSALPAGERNILNMLGLRLICAVGDAHLYTETDVILDCGGVKFSAKGKTVVDNGWKAIEQAFQKNTEKKQETQAENKKEKNLPELTEGHTLENVKAMVKEGFTSAPKRYTEDTLLSAMERAGNEDTQPDVENVGLGTPATRAAVIEKLVKKEFVKRQKKQLVPTEKGMILVRVLPDTLTSPKLTSGWENALSQIACGEFSADAFMKGIGELTWTLVKTNTQPDEKYKALLQKSRPVVGTCPRCGGDVQEGGKGFFCRDNDCGFKLWKDNRFFAIKKKPLTKAVAQALLKDGRVKMTGLYSPKTGKTYNATIIMQPGEKGDKFVNFGMEFNKKGGK